MCVFSTNDQHYGNLLHSPRIAEVELPTDTVAPTKLAPISQNKMKRKHVHDETPCSSLQYLLPSTNATHHPSLSDQAEKLLQRAFLLPASY
jgi:hypothetical protein